MKKVQETLRKVGFVVGQYGWRWKWSIKVTNKFLILSFTKIWLKVDNTNENLDVLWIYMAKKL
jgi:hypothetical protein